MSDQRRGQVRVAGDHLDRLQGLHHPSGNRLPATSSHAQEAAVEPFGRRRQRHSSKLDGAVEPRDQAAGLASEPHGRRRRDDRRRPRPPISAPASTCRAAHRSQHLRAEGVLARGSGKTANLSNGLSASYEGEDRGRGPQHHVRRVDRQGDKRCARSRSARRCRSPDRPRPSSGACLGRDRPEIQYSDLNQPQTITAPQTVRPYSEFSSKVTRWCGPAGRHRPTSRGRARTPAGRARQQLGFGTLGTSTTSSATAVRLGCRQRPLQDAALRVAAQRRLVSRVINWMPVERGPGGASLRPRPLA